MTDPLNEETSCPTCGGSRKIPWDAFNPRTGKNYWKGFLPCPDCYDKYYIKNHLKYKERNENNRQTHPVQEQE